MSEPAPQAGSDQAERLSRLEARVSELEAYVGLLQSRQSPSPDDGTVQGTPRAKTADDLELELGQNWFARVGIIALAAAGAFMLTRPYPHLPPVAPSLGGFVVACALFALARFGTGVFPLVTSYLRGAAMALLYGSALRLAYFGSIPAIRHDSFAATVVLSVASLANIYVAWQRTSIRLMALALLLAASTPIAIGSFGAIAIGGTLCALFASWLSLRSRWHRLFPLGVFCVHAMYACWAMGNPLGGGSYHWVAAPWWAPVLALAFGALFCAAAVRWPGAGADDPPAAGAIAINSCFGYGVLLAHTTATHSPFFAVFHLAAFLVSMSAAAALWWRHRSELGTFFCAMCGYAALSMAIVKLTDVPNVFVWLSAESLLVVATAVWFRSRFIVVANFLIYAATVLSYVLLNEKESGVSIGFGLAALASARILNWQQHRLALKTELMRNAYLVCALIVFPYSLSHLVPIRFVALAWVALAMLYYALNLIIRNQKYRWMGHATLLLTAVYLMLPHAEGLSTGYRITSFIALGAAFVAVSIMMTQAQRRRSTESSPTIPQAPGGATDSRSAVRSPDPA